MTTAPEPDGRIGRRQVLQTSALSVTLGALVAACGESTEGEPGRVGYAPPITPLPTVEENDVVYLRTATSIEATMVELYGVISATEALDDEAQAMLDRLVEEHTAAVETTAALTVEAGGEPYECVNAWYMDRVVDPIVVAIEGDEALDIPPSDQPARDMLVLVNAMESMVAAMYQQMAEQFTKPDLRAEGMVLGAAAARHAAAVALRVTEPPDGYASPGLLGDEIAPVDAEISAVYAIPTQFGSLAAIQVIVGAPNDAGTRFTTIIETPAANSYVYEGETCDA